VSDDLGQAGGHLGPASGAAANEGVDVAAQARLEVRKRRAGMGADRAEGGKQRDAHPGGDECQLDGGFVGAMINVGRVARGLARAGDDFTEDRAEVSGDPCKPIGLEASGR
jgi:hypothetical protein